ncbi:MAG: hypothetical protein LBC70_03775 [Chitinispirillales bacterium]|jgi:hypothetical protein|nr:hypothetical protein [Chitinispirillales bacterium]
MKRTIVAAIALLMFLHLPAAAQVGSGVEVGAGARAMAMANNHTAIAKDLSAVYWNPAALAFLPVREFQMSFDGFRIYGTSELSGPGVTIPPGVKMGDHRDRIRMSGLGAMTAIPTIQGGLTLAASFDRPNIFDDFTVYTYEQFGETVSLDGRKYGDLNRWSGSFGIQVAPNIAAGLTLSVLTGTEKSPIYQVITVGGELVDRDDYYDVEFQHKYLGYAIALGASFHPSDILKIGMKVNAYTNLGLRETQFVGNPDDYYRKRFEDKGRAYIAPSGALGVGLTLPWLITTVDLRMTMPYTFVLPSEDTQRMPDNMQARSFKFGTGLGFEAPLPSAPVVLRAGYSLDEYDLYPIIHKFQGDRIDWNLLGPGYWPDRNRHTLSAGIAAFSSGIGIELSYAYQTWALLNAGGTLRQDYSSHRFMTSFIYRY